jgi:hypothetical protein
MDEMQIHPQSPNDAYGVAIVGLPMVMFISSIQLSIVAGLEEHYRESPSAAHFVTLNLRESVYFRVGVFSCSLFLIWVKVPGGIRLLLGLAVVSWLCLFASLYAIAVVPLPPGKSRISQWCDDIRAGFQKQVRMPAR